MQLDLGQKIRELRRRDGGTQEALAEAIGVKSQAVSRWEANGGYPDMVMIPSIAHYFGISIDELFGYEDERAKKIDELVEKINEKYLTTFQCKPDEKHTCLRFCTSWATSEQAVENFARDLENWTLSIS